MPHSKRLAAAVALDDSRRLSAVAALELDEAEQLPVLARVNDLAQQLLGVPISVVSMVTEGRHVSVSQAGLSEDRRSHLELPLTHTLCQHVVTSGEALVIDDATAHPLSKGTRGVDELGIRAYAGAPLVAGGETIGAVCAIDTRPRQWTGEQLSALSALRDIAAELLGQRLQILQASLRDPVTGLPRADLFLQQVELLQQALEVGEALSVTTVDVEHFGRVNERFGHDGGDLVLRALAQRLSAVVAHPRRPGVATRIGDVFVVASVVSGAEPQGRRARNLQDAAARPIPVGEYHADLVTRVTSFRAADHERAAQLLARATGTG